MRAQICPKTFPVSTRLIFHWFWTSSTARNQELSTELISGLYCIENYTDNEVSRWSSLPLCLSWRMWMRLLREETEHSLEMSVFIELMGPLKVEEYAKSPGIERAREKFTRYLFGILSRCDICCFVYACWVFVGIARSVWSSLSISVFLEGSGRGMLWCQKIWDLYYMSRVQVRICLFVKI